MKDYSSENIRNIALVGHGGCGKTTFLEAALLATGVTNRMGKVEDGNTVSDFDKMEIEKGYSIGLSMVPVEYKDTKINFIDTPGFFDFVGEVNSSMRAAGCAIICVDATSGIQVGTEKAWQACEAWNIPRCFVITKTGKDANVNLNKVAADLKAKFGMTVLSLDNKDGLVEAIAETDEALMEKFFEGEEFTDEEFETGLLQGIRNANITPILNVSADEGKGIIEVLDAIVKYLPNPTQHEVYNALNGAGEAIKVTPDENAPASAIVFKTIADPFLGRISLAKVITGKLTQGVEMYNPHAEKSEKLGSVFFLRGKTQIECKVAHAGDIVALGKLQFAQTGDTLCDKNDVKEYLRISFPQPTLFTAIEAKNKGEDEKLTSSLRKLNEEDPSFSLERNAETHQTLLGTQGDIQSNILLQKLKERYGVEVNIVPQKVAYRETIKGTSDVQGKHKKQSGGAGQYGDVHIRFSPCEEEFEFAEELFGGSVPKNYVPAVEKGLRECMEKGPLAGCKCQNIRAVLYDGSYHEVDSNEMSFKIAASLAFKKGIVEAKPCLLEPIYHVNIKVPDEYTGDVMGDMNKRRGRILGMEPQAGGIQKLQAEAPQSELFDYAIVLRAMTQARGSFTMAFERYEEVPAHLANKIIEAHKAEEE
ncbi:MAG: elongation factor G [Firmicutes bacterium]|nr:elongation factor G [Bacillota bacterium]